MRKIISLVLILISCVIMAQAPKKFYTRFGGYGHDIGYGVIQTLNGQYAVTGSTSSFGNGNTDVYLALVDSMGWVRWEKSYGGFNNDIGKSIIQLKDSGFVIAGYTNSYGSGGYDVFVVRTDKNGVLIWQKAYGGMDWDFGYCVKESNGGDSLIICGSTYSYGYGKSDGYIIKTDINGNFQWQKTYGGAEDDEFKSFVLTYNNQYAFAGTTKSMGDVNGDVWLFKTALSGDSILGLKYGDNKKQFVNDIEESKGNDLVFAGATDINGQDSTYGYLLSLNNSGSFLYENTFPRTEKYKDYQFTSLTKGNRANNFAYVYKTFDAPANSKIEPLFMDIDGMWPSALTTYGSLSDDEIYDISNCKDKGYISVGSTTGFNSNLTDIFLVKLDSTILGSANAVSVHEYSQNNNDHFNIYPTLTKNNIFIEYSGSKLKHNIVIYTLEGKIIRKFVSNETKINYDLSNFDMGLYFIKVYTEQESKIFKIIKTE